VRYVEPVESERDAAGGAGALRPVTVDRAARHDGGVRLELADGRAVQINAQPDLEGVRRVRRVLRRVERVELVLGATALTASVIGVGHRRRSYLPVSLGTALALVLQGTGTTFAISGAHLVSDIAGAPA
jgi:hypothetical protein